MEKSAKALESEAPDRPLVVIEPRRGFLDPNVLELWQHRELLLALVARDIKVRYKQTVLGVLWVVIQPVFLMIVFSFIFGRLSGIPSEGIPYPLFAFAGLVPWTFFANAVTSSGNSLVGNSSLITKVYFPRMIIPVAAVFSGLLDLVISFGFLVALMLYYGTGFSTSLLLLPVLVLVTVLLTISVGMWTSALNVKYRDVRYAIPFLTQIGMFVTPIIYPTSLIPERWVWLFRLNPLTGLIEGYRSAIFGLPFDLTGLAVSIFITLALLAYSIYAFHKMERSFADIV